MVCPIFGKNFRLVLFEFISLKSYFFLPLKSYLFFHFFLSCQDEIQTVCPKPTYASKSGSNPCPSFTAMMMMMFLVMIEDEDDPSWTIMLLVMMMRLRIE